MVEVKWVVDTIILMLGEELFTLVSINTPEKKYIDRLIWAIGDQNEIPVGRN